MPLTDTGHKILASMKKQYGDKKGKEVFYASINSNKPGTSEWHNYKDKDKRSKLQKARLKELS